MLPRNLNSKISLSVRVLFFLLCPAFLILWLPNSLADTSIYFFGGREVFSGSSPYDGDSPFFSGPAGGLSVFLIGRVLSIENYPWIWQAVNLLGVSYFFYFVLRTLKVNRNLVIFTCILLFAAPVREMVVNNQITGFALGSSSLIISLSNRYRSRSGSLVCLVPLYLLFELKPNLVLGFIIYFVYLNRDFLKEIVAGISFVVIFCVLLIGPSTYIEWFRFVLTSGSEKLTGYESLGLSTFLFESGLLGFQSARIIGVSAFLISFLFAVVVLIYVEDNLKLFIAPLLILMFPYIHYLDFISALPFLYALYSRRDKLVFLTSIVFVVFFLPQPSQDLAKNAIILLIAAFFTLLQILQGRNKVGAAIGLSLTLILIVTNYWLSSFQLDDHSLQVMTVVRAWAIIMFAFLYILLKSMFAPEVSDSGKSEIGFLHPRHE